MTELKITLAVEWTESGRPLWVIHVDGYGVTQSEDPDEVYAMAVEYAASVDDSNEDFYRVSETRWA